MLEVALYLALLLHRSESWRCRCSGGRVRYDKQGGVLTEIDPVLHLGETRKGRKGENGVGVDVQASTDVGKGGEVDAGKVVVDGNVKLSHCPCQHGVDQGGDIGIQDVPIPDNDRAGHSVGKHGPAQRRCA